MKNLFVTSTSIQKLSFIGIIPTHQNMFYVEFNWAINNTLYFGFGLKLTTNLRLLRNKYWRQTCFALLTKLLYSHASVRNETKH